MALPRIKLVRAGRREQRGARLSRRANLALSREQAESRPRSLQKTLRHKNVIAHSEGNKHSPGQERVGHDQITVFLFSYLFKNLFIYFYFLNGHVRDDIATLLLLLLAIRPVGQVAALGISAGGHARTFGGNLTAGLKRLSFPRPKAILRLLSKKKRQFCAPLLIGVQSP